MICEVAVALERLSTPSFHLTSPPSGSQARHLGGRHLVSQWEEASSVAEFAMLLPPKHARSAAAQTIHWRSSKSPLNMLRPTNQ